MKSSAAQTVRITRLCSPHLLLGACLLVVTGCTATQQVAVQQEDPAICAFLGEVCKELTAGKEGQAGLRWINPKADLTRYNKVLIEVAGFFGAAAEKVSPEDQQRLTGFTSQTIKEQMGKRFEVVEQPGPGVARIQLVILDAEAATPGLRTVSMVVPQARTLSTVAYAATGKYPFVGGSQAAAKLTDSVTGQVLIAAVDRRVGGGSVEAAAQWKWGDAENAIKAWSELMVNRLYAFTSGAEKP